MNGDVHWFLDLDPPPGGTPGQVVRVDPEGDAWDVLAPSWSELPIRYAAELELCAEPPGGSTLTIHQGVGPACEWGTTQGPPPQRPEWLRDVLARKP